MTARAAIIGGTGTLGQALARELVRRNTEVHVYSRCELKQKEMAALYTGPKPRFTIGDVRDRDSVSRFISRGRFDKVYHVAALKHVDVLESNPEEAVRTNVLGTINVADAAEASSVPLAVFSSTDKAVDPINVYGMTKGLGERLWLNRNAQGSDTRFAVFRWGNVIGSRGSAIPYFIDCIRRQKPIRVTDPDMTRFWIPIEEAVQFMLDNEADAPLTEARIPPMKAASVSEVIQSLAHAIHAPVPRFEIIGNRGGEKQHEFLQSQHHESPIASHTADRLTKRDFMLLFAPFLAVTA